MGQRRGAPRHCPQRIPARRQLESSAGARVLTEKGEAAVQRLRLDLVVAQGGDHRHLGQERGREARPAVPPPAQGTQVHSCRPQLGDRIPAPAKGAGQRAGSSAWALEPRLERSPAKCIICNKPLEAARQSRRPRSNNNWRRKTVPFLFWQRALTFGRRQALARWGSRRCTGRSGRRWRWAGAGRHTCAAWGGASVRQREGAPLRKDGLPLLPAAPWVNNSGGLT